MQISERVEVHIAIERHMRPVGHQRCSFVEIAEDILDTPIPSVGEDQLLPVKRPRLEPTHVSVSEIVINGFGLPIEVWHHIRYATCGEIRDREGPPDIPWRKRPTSIHYILSNESISPSLRFRLVYPIRLEPILARYLTERNGRIRHRRNPPEFLRVNESSTLSEIVEINSLLELLCKRFLVEEHPWIVVSLVEPFF